MNMIKTSKMKKKKNQDITDIYEKKLSRIENSLVAVLTRVSKIFFHNMYQYSFVPITMLLIDWF